jgi:RNA polymerase sigma factor (sigma-70 family)
VIESIDPLLQPYLLAGGGEARQRLEEVLAGHARPLVRTIVRHRLRGREGWPGREAEDLEAEVLVRLVERLDRLRHGGADAIGDFMGYVASCAHHACNDFLRRQRRRGLDAVPLELDQPVIELADSRSNADEEAVLRAKLDALWREIRALPCRQAAALLLGLRDENGREVVSLFPLTGTATLRQIATAIALPAERFAQLWSRLPLDDLTIAEILGATRQQVINLRKSGRERLARRLRGFLS